MIVLIRLLLARLAVPFRSRSSLEAENAALSLSETHPDVLMVKAAENWAPDDRAAMTNAAPGWCILGQ
jgi:hypothetical protein